MARPQFSVKMLLFAVSVTCLVMAAIRREPSLVTAAMIASVAVVLPAFLVAGLICGPRWAKRFCAGALVPASASLVVLADDFRSTMYIAVKFKWEWAAVLREAAAGDFRTTLIPLYAAVPITGLLTVLFCWIIGDEGEQKPPV